MSGAEGPMPPTGPVDCLVVSFPGSKYKREIVPAIKELVDAGTVRILDLVFVQRSTDGQLEVVELSELAGDEVSAFDDLDGEVFELLTEEDIAELAEFVKPGDAAALMVWENTWAARVAVAIRDADGEVVLFERIPRDQVETAWSAASLGSLALSADDRTKGDQT